MRDIIAVIMAGGSGTRFWPASREKNPKQFLSIIGNEPLVRQTFNRITPLIPAGNILMVMNASHKKLTRALFRPGEANILYEPEGRNTAPCIGLAALHILEDYGDVAFVVLPADHYIADEPVFRETLAAGFEAAQDGAFVTLGIVPTHPETGYGYIKKGGNLKKFHDFQSYAVEQFVEKPDFKTALQFLNSKLYYWNAGIFIFTPSRILKEFKRLMPDLYNGLIKLSKCLHKKTYAAALKDFYAHAPSISIDYGLMEKTRHPVYMLPGNFGWSDVGSWEVLYHLRSVSHDSCGNLCDGNTLLLDCHNNFIYSRSSRLVAGLGLNNLLVVDLPDALLLTELQRSQEIKHLQARIKKTGQAYL